MFTSFNSERPASVRVWDYSGRGPNNGVPSVIALADDCEEYQFIKTGGTVNTGSNPAVSVYLPGARIEGKKIVIVNTQFGLSSMPVFIYSSDTGPGSFGGSGTGSALYSIGPGASIELVYSKEFITRGPVGQSRLATGWHPIGMSTPTIPNAWSINMGGRGNVVGGQYCTTLGGSSNSALAQYTSVLGGTSNNCQGAFGSVIGGSSNQVNQQYSGIFCGQGSTANGNASAVLGGSYGNTRFINGNTVFPANFAVTGSSGKAQNTLLVLSALTTNATPTVLVSDPFPASAGNQLALASSGTAYLFKGAVVANNGTSAKGWNLEGVIKRTGAGIALVGTPTVTSPYGDAGAAAWSVALAADATFNCLRVTVTGDAGNPIRWVCELNSTEGVV